MDNELYHHGVLGQKWGVRRYQNKDGSLTYAGKKRALKIQNKYTDFTRDKKYHNKDGSLTYAGRKKDLKLKESYSRLTGGKQLRKFQSNTNNNKSGSNDKPISQMTNEEIQAKIDRINLENNLKSLKPEHISAGKKFMKDLGKAAANLAVEKGTKLAGDAIDKKLREKLKLNKPVSLQDRANEYRARQAIDQGMQYFKEGKYAEKKPKTEPNSGTTSGTTNTKKDAKEKTSSGGSSFFGKQKTRGEYTDTKFDSSFGGNKRTETWTGTVEGKGSNSQSYNKESARKYYRDEPIDVEWREVNSDNINRGISQVNRFLLEDKKHK